MTFKKQSVIFYVLLVVCVAAAVVCVMLGLDAGFQDRLFQFGAKLKGVPLNRDAWGDLTLLFMCVALFFLTVPLYFFNFDGYFVKEEISSDRKRWEMSFCDYVKSYVEFLRNNVWLFALVVFVLIAAYGPRLFNNMISNDTGNHIEQNLWKWMMSIGRFGYSLLQKVFHPFGFNVWLGTYLGFVNLLFGTLAWCHLVSLLFPSAKKVPLAMFAVLFSVSNTWAAQMYFTMQSAEAMFIILASPFALYGLFSGLLVGRWSRITLSVLALIFMVAVYQAAVLLFCAGLLICFVRYTEEDGGEEKERWMLALRLMCAVAVVLGVYFICNKIVLGIFGLQKSEEWEHGYVSLLNRMHLNLVTFSVRLALSNPLPAAILLLSFPPYFFIIRRQKSAARIVSMLLLPATCFVFGMLTGSINFRIQFAMSLVLPFMVFLVYRRFAGGVRRVSLVVAMMLCFLCVEETSMLNWSDLRRYEQDRLVAQDLTLRICSLGVPDEIRRTPVLIYGKYDTNLNGASVIKDMFGVSLFSWYNPQSMLDGTGPAMAFLNDINFLGFNLKPVSENDTRLVMKAREAAKTMSDYPSAGCVRNLGDVIVVRLSETTYDPDKK